MGLLGELLVKLGVDKTALTSGLDDAKAEVSGAASDMGDSYQEGSKKMEEGATKAEKATKSVGSTMLSAVGSTASLAAGAYALYDSYDGVESAQIAAERATLKLSKANEAVEKAQKDYNEAVSKYGEDSPQAIKAAQDLAQAQDAASIAAQNADMATGNVDDAMVSFATGGVMGVVSIISGGAGLVQTLSGLSDIHLPKLSGGISGIGKVFGSLASTLAANPLILILTAVALIAILIITNWDAVKPYFEWLWNALVSIFQTAWNLIDQYVIKPILAAWNWISQGAEVMKGILVGIWNAIYAVLLAVWNWIDQNIIKPIVAAWTAIQNACKIMQDKLTEIWNAIYSAILGVWNWIDENIVTPIKDAWDAITGAAEDMQGGLEDVWNGISSFIDGIVDTIMGFLQPLIDAFNLVADLAGGLGDAVGAVIPDGDLIPGFHLFAEGGYVTSPTMGIFGEEEPEFLVPESKVPSFISYIASKGSNDLGGAISTISAPVVSSSNSHQNVYVTLVSSDPSMAGRALVKELGYRGVKI